MHLSRMLSGLMVAAIALTSVTCLQGGEPDGREMLAELQTLCPDYVTSLILINSDSLDADVKDEGTAPAVQLTHMVAGVGLIASLGSSLGSDAAEKDQVVPSLLDESAMFAIALWPTSEKLPASRDSVEYAGVVIVFLKKDIVSATDWARAHGFRPRVDGLKNTFSTNVAPVRHIRPITERTVVLGSREKDVENFFAADAIAKLKESEAKERVRDAPTFFVLRRNAIAPDDGTAPIPEFFAAPSDESVMRVAYAFSERRAPRFAPGKTITEESNLGISRHDVVTVKSNEDGRLVCELTSTHREGFDAAYRIISANLGMGFYKSVK